LSLSLRQGLQSTGKPREACSESYVVLAFSQGAEKVETWARELSLRSRRCLAYIDDTVRPFRCLAPGCGKAFTRSDLLRRHGQLHGDQEETGRIEGGNKRAASSTSDEPMGKVSGPQGDSPRSRSLQIYMPRVKATEKDTSLVVDLLAASCSGKSSSIYDGS
jgi:hypothetical protein